MQNFNRAFIVSLVLLQSPAFAGDSNSEGIKAFRAGDYAKAERMYILALTEESDKSKVASIYRNLALLYSAQGKDASEFTRKAEQLDPPITPMVVRDKNGDTLIFNGKHAIAPANQDAPPMTASPAVPQAPSGQTRQAADPYNGATPPFFSGGKINSVYETSQIGGSFGINPNRGGFNGGFNARSVTGGPLPFYPQLGGINYTNVGPNGAYSQSEGTPIVLPVPYGMPVILNAPGPNVYSNRRGPDGSNTTFMLRTE